MKILFWTDGFWPRIGGTETQTLQLIKTLQKRGHEIRVLAQKKETLKEEEAYRGIEIKRFCFETILSQKNPQKLLPVEAYFQTTLKEFKPNIIHLHMPLGWSAFAFLLFKNKLPIPSLLTLHSSLFEEGKGVPLIEKFTSAVDRICPVSQSIHDEMETLLPRCCPKLRLNLNGLSPPEILSLPLPFSPATLLLFGRLRQEKGFDTAIRAFALLKNRGELLIAGEGPELSSLKQIATELGVIDSVRFMGNIEREQIPSLINKATIVLVPSYFEAFGLVALEAMQMKRPVIASRVGGLQEIIIHDETGLLIPPKDPEALSSAIEDLLRTPQKAILMGERGYLRSLDWTVEKTALRYEKIYQELL